MLSLTISDFAEAAAASSFSVSSPGRQQVRKFFRDFACCPQYLYKGTTTTRRQTPASTLILVSPFFVLALFVNLGVLSIMQTSTSVEGLGGSKPGSGGGSSSGSTPAEDVGKLKSGPKSLAPPSHSALVFWHCKLFP